MIGTRKLVLIYNSLFLQLTILLAVAVFLYYTLILVSFPEKVYYLRGLFINIFSRVTPIMVPVVLGSASVIINRYTGAFFSLLFKDKYVVALFIIYLLYLLWSIYLTYSTGSSIPGSSELVGNFTKHYKRYLIDTISLGALVSFSLFACLKIFLYTQPKTLSDLLKKRISRDVEKVRKLLFSPVIPSDERMEYLQISITKNIVRFTNLTLLSIKSKDYETIQNNISILGNEIWVTLIVQAWSLDEDQEKKLRKKIYSDFEAVNIQSKADACYEQIIKDSSKYLANVEVEISDVYRDIYESAFSAKEYFACDKIIKHLYELTRTCKEVSISTVLNIYIVLFEVSLSYDQHGYTYEYCKKIFEYVSRINNDRNTKRKKPVTFFKILKLCIDFKEIKVQQIVLEGIKDILNFDETDLFIKSFIYERLRNAGVYSLKVKSMGCFAELIRFVVTKELNLNEVNEWFSKMETEKKTLLEELLLELDTDVDDIFEVTSKQSYYKLKVYIIFFSYFELQVRISQDRIPVEYHSMSIANSVIGKMSFDLLRTVLLDLETHLSNWDKLFVQQATYYFVKSSSLLLNIKDKELLKKEIEIYGGENKLLNKLHKKLYWIDK
ncbi:hypothetical protein [Paenibacillus agricola]|uniref:Uncharacterized protein n=1 Tax=Paenibacillus agricola TaxID=2716264 RepID=A0ABX0JET1_9BACL|nr:hypothetical protein [Paenibacillus agricola]NHN32205.1 hypothetical protein [Paenibacillus agricola]